MTTILDAIRNLEAAHSRGEIDDAEFRRVRGSVMDLIEDAEEVDPEMPDLVTVSEDDEENARYDRPPMSEATQIALLAVLGFITTTGLGTWLLGDVMAAFTLSLGLFTAVTLWAVHRYDLLEDPRVGEVLARLRPGDTDDALTDPDLDPEAPERQTDT